MAYLLQDDEDEEEKKQEPSLAPGAVAGGGMVRGSPSLSGSMAPQQTPQQREGTGSFTNLKNYLQAGQGRHENIQQRGSSLLSTEQNTFNTAAQPLRDVRDDSSQLNDTALNDTLSVAAGNGSMFDGGSGASALTPEGRGRQSSAMDQLQGMITQTYTGPTSVNYDPSTGSSFENLTSLDALSATDTVGAELAGDTPYNAGARRLDNALFGADTASQAAIAGNREGGQRFLEESGREATELNQRATDIAGNYDRARETSLEQLRRAAGGIVGGIDQRVTDANNAEAARRDPGYAATLENMPGYEWTTYEEGSGPATRENMIDQREENSLAALSQLIGGPAITRQGEFRHGNWAEELDTDQAPELQIAPPQFTYRQVAADGQAQREMALGQIIGAIFSGGIGSVVGGIMGSSDPDSNAVRSQEHGEWQDEHGNRVDLYDRNPITGIVRDKMTGEEFLQSEIDNGTVVYDPKTGRYKRKEE